MITCKYDVQQGSRWKECGQPAVEIKITGPTGDGLDCILCPEHLETQFAAGLIEDVRRLLPSSDRRPKENGPA